MNRTERAKVRALSGCTMLPDSFDTRFVRSMVYIADTAADTVLTPPQRYSLDTLVWTYRRQLSGRPGLGFDLPMVAPEYEGYEKPERPKRQGSLL